MESIDKKTINREAAAAGIIFGLISGSYSILSNVHITGLAWGIFSFLLWGAKLAGCIWLMAYFMKKLCGKYDSVTNSDTFRLGALIAIYSALITAAVAYLASAYIFPDALETSVNQAMESYRSLLDSNSMSIMEEMMDKLPLISLISNFLWCTVYGVVLSAILSGRIPEKDPFKSYEKE